MTSNNLSAPSKTLKDIVAECYPRIRLGSCMDCPYCAGIRRYDGDKPKKHRLSFRLELWSDEEGDYTKYRCNVCRAYGDKVAFLMTTRHVTFKDACAYCGVGEDGKPLKEGSV